MSNEICQVDFHDPGTGLTFKAGTYTKSFRELCRRDEAKHRTERERQSAGLAARKRQGLSGSAAATLSGATHHADNGPADDNGFGDYLKRLNGDGANGEDDSADGFDYFAQFSDR